MHILNLRREFEALRMKDKEFSDRLLKVVNQIRILGEELSDKRVVEKVLVSLLNKFEAKISSLEESRDLNEISLLENATSTNTVCIFMVFKEASCSCSIYCRSKICLAVTVANQVIWLRKLLGDLNEQQEEATIIYCDNKSAIAIAENSIKNTAKTS